MVQELDDYCEKDDVSDWELDFIVDMFMYAEEHRGYTAKQKEHVIRLWEKYCG
jgi:hypothetical protein